MRHTMRLKSFNYGFLVLLSIIIYIYMLNSNEAINISGSKHFPFRAIIAHCFTYNCLLANLFYFHKICINALSLECRLFLYAYIRACACSTHWYLLIFLLSHIYFNLFTFPFFLQFHFTFLFCPLLLYIYHSFPLFLIERLYNLKMYVFSFHTIYVLWVLKAWASSFFPFYSPRVKQSVFLFNTIVISPLLDS